MTHSHPHLQLQLQQQWSTQARRLPILRHITTVVEAVVKNRYRCLEHALIATGGLRGIIMSVLALAAWWAVVEHQRHLLPIRLFPPQFNILLLLLLRRPHHHHPRHRPRHFHLQPPNDET